MAGRSRGSIMACARRIYRAGDRVVGPRLAGYGQTLPAVLHVDDGVQMARGSIVDLLLQFSIHRDQLALGRWCVPSSGARVDDAG